MNKGYIKLWRKIREKSWWQKQRFTWGQAWVDFLLRASHKDTELIVNNEIYKVPAGSFVSSQRKLAEDWHWAIGSVSSFLFFLQKTERSIEIKTEHRFTHIFIVKWKEYQRDTERKIETKTERKLNDSRTIAETKQECIKNVKEDSISNQRLSFLISYFITLIGRNRHIQKYSPTEKDIATLRSRLPKFSDDEIKKIFSWYLTTKKSKEYLSISAALSSHSLNLREQERAKTDWQKL